MEKNMIVKITYRPDSSTRFIKGRLIFEDKNFLVVAGLRDGKRFTISKSIILEIAEERQ